MPQHIFKLIIIIAIFSVSLNTTASSELHDNFLASTEVKDSFEITLTENNNAKKVNDSHLVFSIPFPPNYLNDIDSFSLSDPSGNKLNFYPELLAQWNYINSNKDRSTRSIKIYLKNNANFIFPLKLKFKKESNINYLLNTKPKISNEFTTKRINLEFENGLDSISIKEPKIYATYTPSYLSACLFRSKILPSTTSNPLKWFDQASIDYSKSAYSVINGIYVDDRYKINVHRSWQYDLSATLFNTYFKTGEYKWLKQAHIAAQMYAYFINSDGAWTLKRKPDIKFSYNLSMFIDYLLIGDTTLLPKIEAVANFVSKWKYDYKRSYGFWTERHQTYSLLGSIIAWEATSDYKYAERASTIAQASFQEAINPEKPWKPNGCLQHEFGDHDRDEGGKSTIPVCSPWMSALLADAMLRYFIQSGNVESLEFIYGLADFTVNHGLYIADGRKNKGRTIPRYIASPAEELDIGGGIYNDLQHSCDVAGLLGKAIYAGKSINKPTKHLKKTIDKLLIPCEDHLSRNELKSPLTGKTYWRSKPPRKFNWIFGTTSDLSYFYSL